MFSQWLLLALAMQAQDQSSSLVPAEIFNTRTGPQVRVENTTRKTIEALHYMLDCPATAAHGRMILEDHLDPLVNYGSDKPLLPGDFVALPAVKDREGCTSGVDAMLYADGSTEGAPEKVALIRNRRKGALKGLQIGQVYASAMANRDMSAEYAGHELMLEADKARSAASTPPEQREGENYVLVYTTGILKPDARLIIRVPEASEHPPSADMLVRERGYTLDQAHGYIAGVWLKQWESDLRTAISKDQAN